MCINHFLQKVAMANRVIILQILRELAMFIISHRNFSSNLENHPNIFCNTFSSDES